MFAGKIMLAGFLLSTSVLVATPGDGGGAPFYIESQESGGSWEMDVAEPFFQPRVSDSGPDAAAEQPGVSDPEEGVQEDGEPSGFLQSGTGVFQQTGTELAMLPSQGGAQMLSCLIRSENGGLIVIDGGWEADGEYLLETIKDNGGIVDAWLITHPHSDHVGALSYILRNKNDEIQIEKIYYSFAPVSWYEEKNEEDARIVMDLLDQFAAKLPEDAICDSIGKGYEILVDNVTVTVMNNRYIFNDDPVNNSSMVYMVEAGGKKALFLGDLSFDGGSSLLRENGSSLKADIVQMAHHGQNGIGRAVYETISPEICLWPAPQWLWDNDKGEGYDSGSWRTTETRRWMKQLKVKEQLCTKDGTVVLQLE